MTELVTKEEIALENLPTKHTPSSTDVPWDYVFVFNNIKRPNSTGEVSDQDKKLKKWLELQKSRKELVNHLRSVGLRAVRKRSTDGNVMFVLIGASQIRLEAEAEQLDLQMRTKDEFGGGWDEFSIAKKDMFQPDSPDEGFFRQLQRIHLIESIFSGDPDFGGAGLNLDQLVRDGVCEKIYPMHNDEKRKELLSIWGSPKKFLTKQPLQHIRNYLGEEISLYFAWLGFYTQWLWYATIAGLACSVLWLIDRFGHAQYGKWAAWGTTIYAVFLSIWATLFLEYWKRYNNELNYEWGTAEYKEREFERPTFVGLLKQGVYYKGTWVPLEDENALKNSGFHLPPKRKYYSKNSRNLKTGVGFPILATMLIAVVVATFAVLSVRLYIQLSNGNRTGQIGGSVAGAAANAVTIQILNILWRFVAAKLTEWENHRLQSEFENALIFKIFIFFFVNSYTSLYYIAFFKNGSYIFQSAKLIDACKNQTAAVTTPIVSAGCPDELTIQLVTILAVNMFIGQAQEVVIPWAMGRLKLYLLVRNTGEDRKQIPDWERDYKKSPFKGTFDEYSEMIIQFGYLTLFAASFPLAPVMAVLNNMVEIRSDAFKMLTANPRPPYRGASNIGTWYNILEVLGIIAVVTNCALIGLSFEVIIDFFYHKDPVTGVVHDGKFAALGVVVIVEHGILILKFIIAYLVPDYPGWIVKKVALSEFIREESVKAMRKKDYVKPTWEVQSVAEDDDIEERTSSSPTLELKVES